MILETDPATIAGRVAMRGADQDLPLTEQVKLIVLAKHTSILILHAHCLPTMSATEVISTES